MEEQVANFKKEVEWQKMTPMSWHGLKYFIISKKLPQPDVRRYLRQELERLKVGIAAFFKEAEKSGLLKDENSPALLKVAEGKSEPSNEEYRKLNESAVNFGIGAYHELTTPKYVKNARVSCSSLYPSFATRYVRRNFIGPTEKSLPRSFHKKYLPLAGS